MILIAGCFCPVRLTLRHRLDFLSTLISNCIDTAQNKRDSVRGFDGSPLRGQPCGVLREIKGVKQERGAARRRWFESDGLDLVVWLVGAESVIGFQLCYDLGRGEHALTWRPESGFTHSAVDTGEDSPWANRTPILGCARPLRWKEVIRLFDDRSAQLDPILRQFIRTRLVDP